MPLDAALWQLGMSAITAALGVAVGWAMNGLRNAGKKSREEVERQQAQRDEDRAIQRLLLFYRLHDLFERYVVKGDEITSSDKHEIEEVYRHYHDLGGNGEGTRMYHALMELQTI